MRRGTCVLACLAPRRALQGPALHQARTAAQAAVRVLTQPARPMMEAVAISSSSSAIETLPETL